ncbi:MAG TPA: ABC transporter ATP-binding protein/permease [Candidatus Limivivens merdigallinarum]|uniref:ABC transporter ATP-binding protein/permease n=1 Tax=Candidatus Limivivens merdigallinarum TaxID=2840859 RepID=A0A9D0ZWQ8_9FIRM|nr:ABC transporter ATP-binding protein/permease [Candidatus Limivivens merdigallinarum]
MLQIKDICKQYKTGNLIQQALDHVSLNFRDNEFVAILGPSGSGKTTLLNIIGGLDRYDSGDLIINGVSTKKYKDRDWDSYRNHTIGFVFQSYNLIPHQTVLSNVELALTISGISKSQRRERAKKALEQVGLGNQLHKKPSQMSGGQMQRVAIARALVNDPDILLADEPTGALDSDTSIQVMDLLKEVARERLVVMVTHNPELAEQYATRIVNLKDGTIRADSMPYEVNEEAIGTPEHRNLGKSSMSFLTALSLSFNNLKTKKARTLLTSFAGSIGIIGIALILSLSTGVNAYIQSVEEDTLSEYPLEINSTGVDFSSMLMVDGGDESQTGEVGVTEMVTNLFSKMDSNDLSSLKEYLDCGKSGVEEYAKSIEYTYNVSPQIFRTDGDSVRQVNPDRSFSAMGISSDSSNSLMSMSMNTDVFYEMPADSDLYQEQYDVKAGRWPEEYNECVLVLTSGGNISDMMMYTLGLRDAEELDTMVRQFMAEEDVETPSDEGTYSYDDILGTVFKLVNSADYYEYDSEYHVWTDKSGDEAYLKDLVSQGEDLTIVGIVQPSEESDIAMLSTGIGYLPSLTEHVILEASDSEIVKEQLQDRNINVFTGKKFGEQDEEDEFDMTSLFTVDGDAMAEAFQVDESMFQVDLSGLSNLNLDTSAISGAFQIDADSLDLTNLLDFEDLSELTEDLQQDLQNLTKDLDLSMSQEEMQAMTQDLASGFAESLTEEQLEQMNPAGSISDYLQTDEAKQLLSESIRDLILSNMTVSVPEGKLAEIAGSLVVGYQSYAEANDIQETNVGTILAYLQSAEVQQTINSQAEQIIGESVRIDIQPEQLQQVMSALIAGYQNYTAQNSSSDSVSIGQEFLNYLQSEDGQQRIYENIVTSTDIMNLADRISGEVQTQGGDLGEKIQQQISGKIEEAMSQLSQNLETAMQQVAGQIGSSMASAIQQALGQVGSNLENAVSIDEDAFMDAIQVTMDQDELTQLLTSMMSGEDAAYDNNLRMLGYADLDSPSGIAIYPRDFESKEEILAILDDYNARMEAEGQEEKAITYTDMVGTLMSSVTDIIDVISYVLVAFVAISLVVSSIMIGVITYISVLERKKEIGILRAIGASKRNVSQVFNAETFIIGFCAGAMGIGITLLLLIPGNQIIHSIAGRSDINAILPVGYAAVLVALSVLLTLLGGLIPSRKAAKNDPVEALRTE